MKTEEHWSYFYVCSSYKHFEISLFFCCRQLCVQNSRLPLPIESEIYLRRGSTMLPLNVG